MSLMLVFLLNILKEKLLSWAWSAFSSLVQGYKKLHRIQSKHVDGINYCNIVFPWIIPQDFYVFGQWWRVASFHKSVTNYIC